MEIPKGSISWLVGRLHCCEKDSSVEREIRERTEGRADWTEEKIREAIAYALQEHKKNRELYYDVMGGSL